MQDFKSATLHEYGGLILSGVFFKDETLMLFETACN